jgi:hypothetical protein
MKCERTLPRRKHASGALRSTNATAGHAARGTFAEPNKARKHTYGVNQRLTHTIITQPKTPGKLLPKRDKKKIRDHRNVGAKKVTAQVEAGAT